MTDHSWASVIRSGAKARDAERVIAAVNGLTARGEANAGTVIVACTQILAQCITQAPPDVAAEVRNGIMTLIDDFAMQSAIQGTEE